MIDTYLKVKESQNLQLNADQLSLIGITAFFLASKCNELKPLKITFIIDILARGKYTQDQIVAMEMELLKSVSFSVPSKTLLDEALRKFRLIEENLDLVENGQDIKKLKARLTNLCFSATSDMAYLEVESHELAKSLIEKVLE